MLMLSYHHFHLKRVVRDDPDVSDFWQRFDETDGELDTEEEENYSDADENSGDD